MILLTAIGITQLCSILCTLSRSSSSSSSIVISSSSTIVSSMLLVDLLFCSFLAGDSRVGGFRVFRACV